MQDFCRERRVTRRGQVSHVRVQNGLEHNVVAHLFQTSSFRVSAQQFLVF